MLTVNIDQPTQIVDETNLFMTLPSAIEFQKDGRLEKLLANLSPDMPWGIRETAAKKLGTLRNPKALPGLIDALPADPFWMVRCAIIQAIERIGNPEAIPTLKESATNDGYQVVRSYAAKAIERLSQRD